MKNLSISILIDKDKSCNETGYNVDQSDNNISFASPFGLNTNVPLYIDSNISWMSVSMSKLLHL